MSDASEERRPVTERDLPPPDFWALISMLTIPAHVSLGMMPHPGTGQNATNLAEAKHLIDLLSVLEAKTKGNLTDDESLALGKVLHHLRMSFVQAQRLEKT